MKIKTTNKTAKQYEDALIKKGINISTWAKDILYKAKFGKPKTYDLVIKTVAELGFTEMPTYKEICNRATEQGLGLCPPEVGPTLALGLKQRVGEWVYIAMELITVSGGRPRLLFVERLSGGSWLNSRWAFPTLRWNLVDALVFVSSKSLALGNSEFLGALSLERAIKICKDNGLVVYEIK